MLLLFYLVFDKTMHVTTFLSSIWQNNACYVTHKESKTSQIRVIRFM